MRFNQKELYSYVPYCDVFILVLSRDLACEFVSLAKLPHQGPKTTRKVSFDQVSLGFTR